MVLYGSRGGCQSRIGHAFAAAIQVLPPVILKHVIAFEHRFYHLVVLGVSLLKQLLLHQAQPSFVHSQQARLGVGVASLGPDLHTLVKEYLFADCPSYIDIADAGTRSRDAIRIKVANCVCVVLAHLQVQPAKEHKVNEIVHFPLFVKYLVSIQVNDRAFR